MNDYENSMIQPEPREDDEIGREYWDDLRGETKREGEEWTIRDDRAAEWAIEKIRAAREERDRLIGLAELKIAELEEKKQRLRDRCDMETGWLQGKLAEYFDTVPHKATKTTESYSLLTGKLKLKKGGRVMKATDELTAYLKANAPEYLKMSPKWGEFKKRLTITDAGAVDSETGEVVPGVEIEEKNDEFIVEV